MTDDDFVDSLLNSATLAEASKTSYSAHVRMLLRTCVPDHDTRTDPLLYCVLHADTSIASIEACGLSQASKHAMACVVLAAYKHTTCEIDADMEAAHKRWSAYVDAQRGIAKERDTSNAYSQREQAAWIDFDEVVGTEAHLAATEWGSMVHLLIAWYALWPPLRGGDSGLVYIISPSDPRAYDMHGPNVLVIDFGGTSATLAVRIHKTAATMGAIVRVLPPRLLAIVLYNLQRQPRATLFASASGQPFSSEASFTMWANREFARVFGRRVTANILRHAFITHQYGEHMATVSEAQLNHVALSMGHTVKRQRLYRRVGSLA